MALPTAIIGGNPVTHCESFAVFNPATGDEIGRAPSMGNEELESAIKTAQSAYAMWSAQPDDALKSACFDIVACLKKHAEELALLLTKEQGKPLNGLGSRWEIAGAIAWAEYTANMQIPVEILQDNADGRIELHRKPLGVVASITPWNFPVMIAIWHIMPALRTGNTVIIKPSPLTPLATMRLVEILNEVLPAGVVNIVTGNDQGIFNLGAAMSVHPDIQKIVFTGSCATGQQIMRSAATSTKRLTLELGGNDAAIVLADAQPQMIAEALFWGAFINNGQTCAAIKRLYVHDDIHDAVCEALVAYAKTIPVGFGDNEETLLGPVQNKHQLDKIIALVEDAKTRGNLLIGGAAPDGLFYSPTLISNLANGDRLVDEEQFGPVLPIIKYHDVEDAIRLANDSSFGLGGSVWATDTEAAKAVAMRLECGSVWINKHGAIQPNVPFGGIKSSGLGVEFGEDGLFAYTNIQTVFI